MIKVDNLLSHNGEIVERPPASEGARLFLGFDPEAFGSACRRSKQLLTIILQWFFFARLNRGVWIRVLTQRVIIERVRGEKNQ
jgi:hypothetical protein